MVAKIIPFNVTIHREQFFEMNIEFVSWDYEQILSHHNIDISSRLGMSVREYVESMFDDLVALKPPSGIIYVLEVDDVLAGMGAIKTLEKGIGEIKRMFIRPKYRGQGHGAEIMKALVAKAEEMGYSTLRLETADFMPAALKIYRLAGFKERGEYPGGEVPDWYRPHCIFMEKVL